MNKQLKKAQGGVVACFSYKGHDFCCCGDRRYVKKTTRRAVRRLNKILSRGED